MPKRRETAAKRKPGQDKYPKAVSKRPASLGAEPEKRLFRWSTQSADFHGRWGWDEVGVKVLFQEIIPKLQQHENRTWGEIEGSQSHFVYMDQCVGEARKRLREIGLDDVEQLFSLRLSGKKRVWGRCQQSVFQVLWWDPEHEVCPSTMRRT